MNLLKEKLAQEEKDLAASWNDGMEENS
jgi:hypothetical protein